jgi:predicted DNA binding CopG/RHH family protein
MPTNKTPKKRGRKPLPKADLKKGITFRLHQDQIKKIKDKAAEQRIDGVKVIEYALEYIDHLPWEMIQRKRAGLE